MDEQEFLLMLQKYADVIVKIGLNLQPGQRLIIDTDIYDAQLARQVAKSAYKAEAKFVDVLYRDSYLERATVEYAPVDGLGEGFAWRANALLEYLDKGDAFLIIDATDPDLMQGLSPERISHFQHAYRENLKQVWVHWRKLSINRCIVVGTNIDWAIKVLPDIPKDEAKDRIWETIFRLCRIDQDDPVAAWQEHMADLTARCNHMNAKRYRHLEYRAVGTNLKVGLPTNHIWSCGRIKSQNGIENTPNIPTEEIFTLPHKEMTEGVVSITKPINLLGDIIDGVTLAFENGKVTKISARRGEGKLRELIDLDEGASYLGEVALVPDSTPISRSGLIFYNILYDENAASHIALGSAYRVSMINGNELSDEEFAKHGGNVSGLHLDCMIGSSNMDVDGILADGTREAVMRSGEWTFKA